MTDAVKKAPDWERIELDYRAGALSLREIASQHGIAEGTIRARAKKNDWLRDLSQKVNQKVSDLLRKKELRSELRSSEAYNERLLIESNALAIANVRLTHRSDISRFKRLSIKLLDELESQTDHQDLYQELGELLRQPSESGQDRRNDLYQRVIDMPSRIDGVKKLADTLKILIGLEREAYSINEKTEDKNTLVTIDVTPTRERVKEIMQDLEHEY
jgi:hypothetical protein